MSKEIDFFKTVTRTGTIELDLPAEQKKLLEGVEKDVVSASVVKWEYLSCLCLVEVDPKKTVKSKERLQKYCVSISSVASKRWQEVLPQPLADAIDIYLGNKPVKPPAAADEEEGKKDKKEKKEKKDKDKSEKKKDKKDKKDKKEKKSK